MRNIYENDGIRMKYARFGSGEKTLVIIPGLSVRDVTDNIEPVEQAYSVFTDEYTVYLFDRRSDIEEGYSIRDMADDTYKVIRALGIEKADLFSVSQGAMIAVRMAIDHPELVGKLVAGSVPLRSYPDTLKILEGWIEAAGKQDEKSFSDRLIEDIYSPDTIRSFGDILRAGFNGLSEEDYRRFIILASACMDTGIYDELGSLSVPMLLIGAQGDRIAPPEAIKDIQEKCGCEMYMYPDNYAHAVYDEAPDYKDRILEFFHK